VKLVQDIMRKLEPTYGPMHAVLRDSILDHWQIEVWRRGRHDALVVQLEPFSSIEDIERKIVAALQQESP
jgi:hypothetical protein